MKKIDSDLCVWIPLFGIIVMFIKTDYNRFRTIYFAGWGWKPYQLICFIVSYIIVLQINI